MTKGLGNVIPFTADDGTTQGHTHCQLSVFGLMLEKCVSDAAKLPSGSFRLQALFEVSMSQASTSHIPHYLTDFMNSLMSAKLERGGKPSASC